MQKEIYDNAIMNFTEVIRLEPNVVAAYFNRGMVYTHIKIGYKVLAIPDYTDAIRLGIDNPYTAAAAYYNRGLAYKVRGIYFKAIEDLEMASSLDPSNSQTRGALERTKDEQRRMSNGPAEEAQTGY